MTAPLVVLFDDATARTFAPFALTRPIGSLRAGCELIQTRWARAFATQSSVFSSLPHLAGFSEDGASRTVSGVLPAGTIIANARCVVALGVRAGDADLWRVGEEIGAVRLRSTLAASAIANGGRTLESFAVPESREARLAGRWLHSAWDIVGQLPEQLAEDVAALVAAHTGAPPQCEHRIGDHPIVIEEDVVIEPMVMFDTTAGAIVIRRGAHVESFTRIAGPCVIGERTRLHGGRINGSAIGDDCRVHGDVSTSVFIGHANKAHEGFVGHSVIGRWANLGAGTTTSNLKNSYGTVRMWNPTGERDTGLQFLGSLIGDHAKLGIGTMLGTGTVIGAGANVFGSKGVPPKRVQPFAWGDAPPYRTFALDKFLQIAERVMQRRHVALTDAQRALFTSAHALVGMSEW